MNNETILFWADYCKKDIRIRNLIGSLTFSEFLTLSDVVALASMSEKEAIHLLKVDLPKHGLGRFIVGRKKKESRLKWGIDVPDFCNKVLSTCAKLLTYEPEIVEHSITIREGVQAKIKVPSDLTALEAGKLAKIVQQLWM